MVRQIFLVLFFAYIPLCYGAKTQSIPPIKQYDIPPDRHLKYQTPDQAGQARAGYSSDLEYVSWEFAIEGAGDQYRSNLIQYNFDKTFPSGSVSPYPILGTEEKICLGDYFFDRDRKYTVCKLLPNVVAESRDLGKPKGYCPPGNPINQANGNKFQIETDYSAPDNSSLNFVRTYNSSDAVVSGSIGQKWRHSYDRSIDATSGVVIVYRQDGKVFSFIKDTNAGWFTNADISLTLNGVTDANGDLTSWELKDGQGNVELYSLEGLLSQISSKQGVILDLEYDPFGALIAVSNTFGRTLVLDYNADGLLSSLTDPAGHMTKYFYGASANLERIEFPDGKVREYLYNEAAHIGGSNFPHTLTGIVDNGVRYATYNYDNLGRGIATEHASNTERFSIEYSSPGAAGNHTDAVVTHPNGGEVTYQFDVVNHSLKLLATDTDCGACGVATQTTEYDDEGYIEKRIDHNGVETLFEHNDRGLQESRTEAVNTSIERLIETDWHSEFRLPTEIREPGRTTVHGYDAVGNKEYTTVTDLVTGESRTTSWTYFPYGKVHTIDGPRTDISDITTYEYDANWNLSKIINALGHETEVTHYDAHGNPTKILDPNDVELLLEYDTRQRLKQYEIDGDVTNLSYNPIGKLERVTFPTGGYLQYFYDDAQLVHYIEDSFGNRIDYSRDAGGDIDKIDILDSASVLRYAQTRVYDVFSRLQEVITAGTDSVTYDYDPVGNLKTITEAGVHQTIREFDALDRLFRVTDPGQGITQFEYDQYGNLWKVTDAEGLVTEYKYNALGDLKELHSPDTGITLYQYDAAGNQKQVTDARGVITTFEYDALNRLISIGYPNASENVTYLYDGSNYPNGELYGITRLTGMDDAAGSSVFHYDAKGNLTVHTNTISTIGFVTQYDYDANGNLSQTVLPSGRIIDYNRDVMGQITTVTSTYDGQTKTLASGITHEPFGPLKEAVMGNGIAMAVGYDTGYRPETLDHDTVMSRQYYYSNRGNIDAVQDLLDAGLSQSFDYDAMSRLTFAQGNYGDLGYDYDMVGNRESQTIDGVNSTNNYLPGTHRISSGNGKSYSYDSAGNAISRDGISLHYNNAGRLGQVGDTGSVKYLAKYNGFGQRAVKTDAQDEDLIFQYDEAGKLLGEYKSDGTVVREYIYREDTLLAMMSTQTPENYSPENILIGTSDANGMPVTFWQDSSGMMVSSTPPASNGTQFDPSQDPDWFAEVTGDFDGNGQLDVWWRNSVTGESGVSLVDGSSANFAVAPTVPIAWNIEATGEFNGDGKSDLFWRNSETGQTAVWLMNGQYILAGYYPGTVADLNWTVSDVADTDGDGISEVVWRNVDTGQNIIWYLDETGYQGLAHINYIVDQGWTIAGTGDINGDGNADLIWYHSVQNITWGYLMDGGTVLNSGQLGPLSGPAELLTTGDIDGDGNDDLVWDDNGEQKIWFMDGLQIRDTQSAIDFDTASIQRVYYYHTDHLGTPQALTDHSGSIVWQGEYDPFGEADEVVAHITQPIRFPGQYLDVEIGLHYNYFRDYDPSLGRYIQSDPIGLAGGINTYAYVGGNPLSYIDPLGLYTEVIVWQPYGWGGSSMGHVSGNINGENFSFGPAGWDSRPMALTYTERQKEFRGGTGAILDLTPSQEAELANCLSNSGGDYDAISNNCVTPFKDCLNALGLNVGYPLFPVDLGDALLNAEELIGTTIYEGPPRGFFKNIIRGDAPDAPWVR